MTHCEDFAGNLKLPPTGFAWGTELALRLCRGGNRSEELAMLSLERDKLFFQDPLRLILPARRDTGIPACCTADAGPQGLPVGQQRVRITFRGVLE
jgi:hypothetical protein